MATAQLLGPDGVLLLVASVGFGRAFVEHFATTGGGGTACTSALTNRAPVEVTEVRTDPVYGTADRRAMLAASSRACVSVPLVGGRGTSVLGVISSHFHSPGHHDVAATESVADEIGRLLDRTGNLDAVRAELDLASAGGTVSLVTFISRPAETESTHTWRRQAAIRRVVARHEQSAVFHEMAATRFERHGRAGDAANERRLADEQVIAAALDRDLLDTP